MESEPLAAGNKGCGGEGEGTDRLRQSCGKKIYSCGGCGVEDVEADWSSQS